VIKVPFWPHPRTTNSRRARGLGCDDRVGGTHCGLEAVACARASDGPGDWSKVPQARRELAGRAVQVVRSEDFSPGVKFWWRSLGK